MILIKLVLIKIIFSQTSEVVDNLARSAKVAERAICFTDRNFYLFFVFLMISRRQII